MGIGETILPMTYTPLRDEVLNTLRQALITGGFAAGERIREVELAARLGVSRGTLREALRHLEQEGLIVTNPHRGTFVVNPTAEEVADIFGLRIALEAYAAEAAAEVITPDQVAALQSVVDDFNAMADVTSLAPRLELDFQFHELLCEAANNARLLHVWSELCGPLRVLLAAQEKPFLDSHEVGHQHQHVVDALRRGDGRGARDEVVHHLTLSRDRMIAVLRAKREGGLRDPLLESQR
jgi:DNA-binding GntR family transcriptional regulator